MTGRIDTERVLDLFLAPEPDRLADRVIDAAMSEVARTPQRSPLRRPWTLSPLRTRPRAMAFAAVLVVAVLGASIIDSLLGRSVSTGGDPTPSPSVPAGESPAPSPRPTGPIQLRRTDGTGILDPGTYVLALFPTDLGFDIPDGQPPGWRVDNSSATHASISWAEAGPIGYALSFFIVETVHSNPCNQRGGVEPVLGPTVDDLISSLSSQEQFQVSAPVEIVVGAFRGKEITMTGLDGEGTCREMWAWAGGHKISLDPGEERILWVLDADGVPVVIEKWETEAPNPAVEAELEQILASFRMAYIAPRPSG